MKLLTDKDIRKKFLLVLFLFALYKIGTYIPVPGTNAELLKSIVESNQALGMANMFSGGSLSNFSIFAIGIMPYITASIIVQLLALDIIPSISEWKRQGEDGNKKMKKLTYKLTIIFAILQSIGLSLGFNKMMVGIVEDNFINYVIVAACLTLGTVILLIFAEIIERKAIGKGVSMIILAGILMVIPNTVYQYVLTAQGEGNLLDFKFVSTTLIFVAIILVLFLAVIQVHRGERRIPITNTNTNNFDITRKSSFNASMNYLPIKLNPSGVIPVIFASALFMTPRTVAMMFPEAKASIWINTYVNQTSAIGMVVFAILILAFTYFYGFISLNPEKMADDLKKGNSFIPGIRPGKQTEDKIKHIMKHLLFLGAIFLAIIAILPSIVSGLANLPETVVIGGTSLIILVNVLSDLKDQVSTDTIKKSYKGFIKKP